MSEFTVTLLYALGSFVAGGAALYYIYWLLARAEASIGWPTAEGTIKRSDVAPYRGKGGKNYVPEVRYDYQVAGTAHRGWRITWDTPASKQIEAAQALLKAFPVGQRVKVYYDPRKPALSLLSPGPVQRSMTIVLVGVGTSCVVFAAFIAWLAFSIG